jgi:cyclase
MSVADASRRGLPTMALTRIVMLAISVASCSPAAPEPPFTLEQVGRDVWAAIDNPRSATRAVANAGFVIGESGVVVIDTLGTAGAAPHLLAAIRRLTAQPVKFVINTHYHLDHVAGNRIFADLGVTILAHRNVRDWVHTENLRLFGPDIPPELKALTDGIVRPTMVYDQGVSIYLGSREIRIQSFPGHTGGDSIVLIPDAKVVFAGDLLANNVLPSLGDASTGPWIESLDAMLAADSGYAFVPGHGSIGDADDVASFRDYLKTLRARVVMARTEGRSGDEAVGMVVPVLRERYGRWEFFDDIAKANVLETYAELSGSKTIPRVQSLPP